MPSYSLSAAIRSATGIAALVMFVLVSLASSCGAGEWIEITNHSDQSVFVVGFAVQHPDYIERQSETERKYANGGTGSNPIEILPEGETSMFIRRSSKALERAKWTYVFDAYNGMGKLVSRTVYTVPQLDTAGGRVALEQPTISEEVATLGTPTIQPSPTATLERTMPPTPTVTTLKAGGEINIPDPEMLAAIRSALGKPTGGITQGDMLTLTVLDAADHAITEIRGLEHAVNLVTLYLHDNQISDITPLAALTKLVDLRLYVNQIVDISSLSELSSLEYLNLSNNELSDITSLSRLSNLAELNLDYSEVSDISAVADLPSLKVLRLFLNPLNEEAHRVHIPALRSRGVDVYWKPQLRPQNAN